MKAIVYREYGPPDVLHLEEVAKPQPKDDEVLIRVHASSVTTGDVNCRGFVFVPPGFGPVPRLVFGLRRPKRSILGFEIAGEIEAVGKNVKTFSKGDPVFGVTGLRFGAYAEYACLPEKAPLVRKPVNLSYEEAVSLPFGGTTALYFLRDLARLQPGQKVLVNGASGCVGASAVQLARHFGAAVTGVCSTSNVELVRSLGATEVIDYTRDDFRNRGELYDVIVDTVVRKTSFAACKKALKPKGLYLAVAGGLKESLQMVWTAFVGGKRVLAGTPPDRKEDLLFLKELAEAGQLKPVIDKRFPLEQAADAHRYVDTGRKRGSVVLTVIPAG